MKQTNVKSMQPTEFETALGTLDLSKVILVKENLITDAHEREDPTAKLFAESLPKDEWTAAELLSTFESSDFFIHATEDVTLIQRIEITQKIRHFIVNCSAFESRKQHFQAINITNWEAREIRKNIRDFVNNLLIDKLKKQAEKDPPLIELEHLYFGIVRVSQCIRVKLKERIERHQVELLALQEESDEDEEVIQKEKELIKRSQEDFEIVSAVLKEMCREISGKTDAAFYIQEINARLYSSNPEKRAELLHAIVQELNTITGQEVARHEPGFKETNEANQMVFLLMIRYRYEYVLRQIQNVTQ